MSKDLMNTQLTQLFEYAELYKRLGDCMQLLDIKDGYAGEEKVAKEIKKLQETIKQQMKIHMNNSGVSERAMTIINNLRYM